MSDDITTGEIGRRVDALATTVSNGMAELRTAVEARPDWADVRRVEKGLLEKIEALTLRVAKSESWGTWLGKTVGGVVVLALLAVVIVKP